VKQIDFVAALGDPQRYWHKNAIRKFARQLKARLRRRTIPVEIRVYVMERRDARTRREIKRGRWLSAAPKFVEQYTDLKPARTDV
jgi:hypothetical protein